jgi:hypothetical protein
MRKRVCDDQGDDGPFGVNCYHALARDDGHITKYGESLESDQVID